MRLFLALTLLSLAVLSAPTSIVLLSRTLETLPKGWVSLGRAAGTVKHSFTIAVRQNAFGVEKLKRLVETISDPRHANYANYLTTENIRTMVRSNQADIDTVKNWLVAGGVSDFAVFADSIHVQTTVEAVEKLFGTTMHLYRHNDSQKKAVRLMGSAAVPTAVDAAIDFITNLSEFPIVRKVHVPRAAATVTVGDSPDYYVTPTSLFNLYSIPRNPAYAPKNNSMGVVEFGGNSAGFVKTDWSSFFSQVAAQSTPGYPLTFGSFTPGGDPNLDTECTLDIEYIQGLSNVTSWFWTIDNGWVYEMANSLAEATKFPLVASVSYGWGEGEQCDVSPCKPFEDSKKYVLRSDTELAKLAAKGISVIVASGDTGAQGLGDNDSQMCQNTKVPTFNPDYPGNSPYVTGVGATMLMNDAPASYSTPYCSDPNSQFTPCSQGTGYEVACSYPRAKITSGGGFSSINSAPSWQTAAINAYLTNSSVTLPPSKLFNKGGRGSPDVSFLGHNYLIFDTNEGGEAPNVFPVDGTSASAPGFAAVISILNAYQLSNTGKPLGFLNPFLYQNPQAFNDVTQGNNKCTEETCCPYGYEATTGWDPLTGLGTPNFPALLSALQSMNSQRRTLGYAN